MPFIIARQRLFFLFGPPLPPLALPPIIPSLSSDWDKILGKHGDDLRNDNKLSLGLCWSLDRQQNAKYSRGRESF
jgi:hypothetical protein